MHLLTHSIQNTNQNQCRVFGEESVRFYHVNSSRKLIPHVGLAIAPISTVKGSPLPIPVVVQKKDGVKRTLAEAFGTQHDFARKKTIGVEQKRQEVYTAAKTVLGLFGANCAVCVLQNSTGTTSISHTLDHCPHFQPSQLNRLHQVRHKLNLKSATRKLCWHCLLPSGGSNELHPEFKQGASICPNPHIAWPLIGWLYFDNKLRKAAEKEFGVPPGGWQDLEKYILWAVGDEAQFFNRTLHMIVWIASVHNLISLQ